MDPLGAICLKIARSTCWLLMLSDQHLDLVVMTSHEYVESGENDVSRQTLILYECDPLGTLGIQAVILFP